MSCLLLFSSRETRFRLFCHALEMCKAAEREDSAAEKDIRHACPACTAVRAMVFTISCTLHPRDRSLQGFASPWSTA